MPCRADLGGGSCPGSHLRVWSGKTRPSAELGKRQGNWKRIHSTQGQEEALAGPGPAARGGVGLACPRVRKARAGAEARELTGACPRAACGRRWTPATGLMSGTQHSPRNLLQTAVRLLCREWIARRRSGEPRGFRVVGSQQQVTPDMILAWTLVTVERVRGRWSQEEFHVFPR